MTQMRVSVFGLGYVGCVSAACLARAGHDVIGVDVSPEKVQATAGGRSPIVEPGMDELVAQVVQQGRLTATLDARAAVNGTDAALICVGTPATGDGRPDTSAIASVASDIERAIIDSGRVEPFTVVLRSTALPGAVDDILAPALGRALDDGRIQVAVNPEFMREGTAIADFEHPPMVLIGADHRTAADVVRGLYSRVSASVVVTSIRTAQAVKYASNAFHALKVDFANEMGTVADALGADAIEVMRIFALDRQLNLSDAYLRPGFAFGGSCLAKDVRALVRSGTEAGMDTPLLSAILPSNARQIDRAIELILGTGKRRVGVLGLAFKPGTDDVRESAVVKLVDALIQRGCAVRVFDPDVELTRLLGANRRYLTSALPDFAAVMCADAETLLAHADVLVIGRPTPAAARVAAQASPDCVVIDLTRGQSSAYSSR